MSWHRQTYKPERPVWSSSGVLLDSLGRSSQSLSESQKVVTYDAMGRRDAVLLVTV